MDEQAVGELMIAAMARDLAGTPVVTGATYCSQVAAIVAQRVHDPDITLLTNYGLVDATELVVTPTTAEFVARPSASAVLGQPEMFDFVLGARMAIWISPAQVDELGSANIAYIGEFARPKVALVGPRGLPDDGTNLERMSYYVTRHSPRSVVPRVDHVSAPGFVPEREEAGLTDGRPGTLVSDLGVFDWVADGGGPRLRARSLHPGVTPAQVREATPFEVGIADDVARTEPPSAAERQAIHAADPYECRRLEFLAGAEAAEHLERVLAREAELWEEMAPDMGWGAAA